MLPITTIDPEKILGMLKKTSYILEHHDGIESILFIIYDSDEESYSVGEFFDEDFFPQYEISRDSMLRLAKKSVRLYEVFDKEGESHDIQFLAPVAI